MLPTFVIIGTMKGGTTSLFYYLAEHPQVRMASLRESDFFVARRNYGKGLAWYESLYDGPEGPSIFGESSPNYAKRQFFPGVPERMHAAVPNARLVYCLRDPIDRIVSHWVHNVSQGRESASLDDALSDPAENTYVRTSQYHYQIRAFLSYYGLDDVLFVDSNELRSDRRRTLRDVFDFVGADPAFEAPAFDRLHHVSSIKERPARMDRFVPSVRLRKALRPLLPAYLGAPRPIEDAAMSPVVRDRIAGVLHADAEALRSLTGKKFEGWSV
ncbi:MAG: sulfotransferase [Gemmatimonadota bacterium]